MNLEVLISTMNKNTNLDNQKLIEKMKIKGNSLTISQTNKNGKEEGKNRILYVNEKGLSKSRNLAIDNANADIVLIADDDVIYDEDYEKTILEAYKENKNADMIAFYVKSRNPKRKVRKLKSGKIGWIRIFRVSSFQLTFKLESIKENGLVFDENFGAGSENFCGEETIFLSDCLRKGLNLLYVDKKIGEVEQKESSWFKGFDKQYFMIEKQCFKRIAPKLWGILWVLFVVRKLLTVICFNAIIGLKKILNKRYHIW